MHCWEYSFSNFRKISDRPRLGDSMIHAIVFTNLDEYMKEQWPSAFCGIPRVGDRVQAKSGKTLRVVGVTHCFDEQINSAQCDHTGMCTRLIEHLPYIKVELSK